MASNNKEQTPVQQETAGYLEVPSDDKSLYFSDTFLKVRFLSSDSPNFHWCAVSGCGEDLLEIVHPEHGLANVRYSDIEIDFSFPEVGMYNYKKSVIHFCRTNARQNKKGLCAATSNIVPVDYFMPGLNLPYSFRIRQAWQWRLPNVQGAFFSNINDNFEKAFVEVAKLRAFARTVNRNFFISPGIDTKYPALWFRRSFVGTVLSEKEIVVRNPAFFQEVFDFFSQKGVSVNAA